MWDNFDEFNYLKGGNERETKTNLSTLDLCGLELQDIFGERDSQFEFDIEGSKEYVFRNYFIDKIDHYMYTDENLLNRFEQKTWDNFVLFQDNHSHSADSEDDVNAIGCTIPVNDISYIVNNSGTTNVVCDLPLFNVDEEVLYKALDTALVNMVNGQPYNDVELEKLVFEFIQ